MRKADKTIKVSPFLLVLLSFLIVILLGSFLLSLPFANTDKQWGNYIDCLFTATSATCVTGLNVLPGGLLGDLTFFGQLVVLICIKVGGLGFITIFAFIVTLFQKKMQFKDRFFLSQAVGSEKMSDLTKFVRKIIIISATFEIIGILATFPIMICYCYPGDFWSSLWASVFHSISAYNNAGFDIFGTGSLILGYGGVIDLLPSWAYVYLCCLTMFLIVSGGISFLVLIDIFHFRSPKSWRALTKIILVMSGILIVCGTVVFLLSEGLKADDPMDFLDAVFQSVTLRTAGFATYEQSHLSTAGTVVSCLLMFIGGSPLSTAGGIKTATFFIIIVGIVSYLRGSNVRSFKRNFSHKMVLKAMSIAFLGLFVIIVGFLFLSGFESGNVYTANSVYLIYEVFSAFGTVGVSMGITTGLSIGSKIVLCLIMFVGRLGPITIFQVFQKNMGLEETRHYRNVNEDIVAG